MASFKLELPTDILKDLQTISSNADEIFGGMTRAGAETALKAVKANAPAGWKDSSIMDCIGLTRTYKTPSDDGINTKVIISGYFENENGQRTPAPLVANVFEYGSTKFQKRPFFRKSFNAGEIEEAMMRKQRELSGGLLTDE